MCPPPHTHTHTHTQTHTHKHTHHTHTHTNTHTTHTHTQIPTLVICLRWFIIMYYVIVGCDVGGDVCTVGLTVASLTHRPDKYHLLDNNCNSFTNEVSQFLTGNPIPSYITGLPAEIMET